MANKYLVTIILTMAASALQAQEFYIYPSEGQSTEQLDKDKFECYGWAKNDTGFDPMEIPKATKRPPSEQKKSGGAVRGVLGGAVLGGILGDSSKSAKRGAAAGGLLGGARQSSHNQQVERERNQWGQEQSALYAQRRNNYNRAYSACLEGRGYTVK